MSNLTQAEQLQAELREQEALQYSPPVEPEVVLVAKPAKPFPPAPKPGATITAPTK